MEKKREKILFLEDEAVIREVLCEYMKISGYEVTEAEDGDQALQLLRTSEACFDMAILDIMVPGPDGLQVLAYIRSRWPEMPVIMLTALGDEKTQLDAFNAYADDYVIKPVSPVILLKRMETILRRARRGKENKETSGLVISQEACQAYFNGRSLELTVSEFLLLDTLYQEPSRVFTREQLILRIYNEDYIGNDRIIDAHVKNLRKKLPVNCIRTVIGMGYRFRKGDEDIL